MRFELANVERLNLGLSAGAVAASLALATPHFATSLAAGALLEALNFGAMRRSAQRFFAGELTRSWTGGFALRFLALGAGIFLTLQAGAHPVALLIGLSLAMPAVLLDAWLNRPPILDPATLPVLVEDELDDEARELAELNARDERLSVMGSVMGSLFRTRILPVSSASDALHAVRATSAATPSSPASATPVAERLAPSSPLTDAETTADETRR